MFKVFHQQFAPSMDNIFDADFIQSLPQREVWPFIPFSEVELKEALSTCSITSALGPSHMSWRLLKLFFADDAFRTQFLQLASDIINDGI